MACSLDEAGALVLTVLTLCGVLHPCPRTPHHSTIQPTFKQQEYEGIEVQAHLGLSQSFLEPFSESHLMTGHQPELLMTLSPKQSALTAAPGPAGSQKGEGSGEANSKQCQPGHQEPALR